MASPDRLLVWLGGEIKTPPMSRDARIEAGFLLRRLQRMEHLGMPHSRPMRSIGPRCHELRINDVGGAWRIIHRIDRDAVVIVEVFRKSTVTTPKAVIDKCKQRLKEYDDA